jgi:hypothetical protein
MPTPDQIAARELESAGNIVSGLDLTAIGKDGHQIANLLWQVAAHLKSRARGTGHE